MEEQKNAPRHRPYRYDLGNTFSTRHGLMTVVDRQRVCRNGKNFLKYYTLQCARGHRYEVKEEYLSAGRLKTCKMCNHPTIAEADPEFASWFVDPALPRALPCGTHKNADFYCPRCGKIVQNKSVHNVHKRREVPCPYCTNGVSYPERYLMALLEQMGVSFQREYTVHFVRAGQPVWYRYDFYDAERKLFIETHGPQHYLPGTFARVGGQTLEEIQQNDAEKERRAVEELGIRYLALDCRRSDPRWIRREAEKKLYFYPLETVDWEQVQQKANKSVVLQMIQLARQGYTCKQIGAVVHMHSSVVCGRLQQACRDGLYEGRPPRQKALKEPKEKKAKKEKVTPPKRKTRAELADAACQRREAALRALPDPLVWQEKEPVEGDQALFLCKACGQTIRCRVQTMLAGRSCPYCRKRTALQEKLDRRYGNTYEILSHYTDSGTPLRVRHTVCGSVFEKTSSALLAGGCPVCARQRRLQNAAAQQRRKKGEEKFFALLPEFERRGYPYAGEVFQGYGNANAFRCSHCGELWWTTAVSILNGRNHICCSPCRQKNHEAFVQEIRTLVGETYTVLGRYQSAHRPVKVRHNVCGLEYLVTPAHFVSDGRRCPVCTAAPRKTPQQVEVMLAKKQKLYAAWEEGLRNHGKASCRQESWNRTYAALQAFYRQEGHGDLPYDYRVEDCELGSWLSDQKKAYHKGKLSPEKVRLLESVGVRWNRKEEDWNQMCREVQAFLQKEGWPRLHGERPTERRYYYWIQDQVSYARAGKLSAARLERLEQIGVCWAYQRQQHFDAMCRKLQRFVEQHGHCVVPVEEGGNEANPLGRWAQRMRIQLAAGSLPPDRAARLLALGMPKNNKEAKFSYKLARLTQYYRAHGHLHIPQSYIEEGERLGKWINALRVQYHKGILQPERVAALEAIGMIWDAGGRTILPVVPAQPPDVAGIATP